MNKPKFPFFELLIGSSLFFFGLRGIKKGSSSLKATIFSKLGGVGDFLSKMPIIGTGTLFSKILCVVGAILLLIAVIKIIMIVAVLLKARKHQKALKHTMQRQEQLIQEQGAQQMQLQRSDKF